jgi:hypothetical protein
MKAPIALFTYNRLSHTKELVESLQKNEMASESDLFIFSDGGKNEEDKQKVLEVRSYLQTIKCFKSVTIEESLENRGLANSVIYGVSKILEHFDRIIVLEDDFVLSPYFLRFMNEALDIYVDEEKVGCVNGHVMDLKTYQPETFFIRHTDSVGWGTWRRAWKLFEPDGKKLLSELEERGLCDVFNMDGTYPFIKMLRKQIAGQNSSWAIRWRASMLLNDKVSINAGKSLVEHRGSDGSGTHCGKGELFPSKLFSERPLCIVKEEPIETPEARRVMKRMYRWYNSKIHKAWIEISYRIRLLCV